jgi:hypothetical protein
LAPGGVSVGNNAEFHLRTLSGPLFGGIVNDVSIRCHLNQDTHPDRTMGNSVLNFVEEKTRVLLDGRGWLEIIVAVLRERCGSGRTSWSSVIGGTICSVPWGNAWRSKRRADSLFAKTAKD